MAQAAYGGTYGGSYRLNLDISETGVNVAGNYSSLHIHAYMTRVSSTGGDIFNNSGTGWNVSVAGNNWSGSIVYGHLGAGGTVEMGSWDINVGHDGNGNLTIGYSANHNANDSPYLTSASLSGSMGLTHINRYANITSTTIDQVTDTSVRLNWSADATCDYITWWSSEISGGAHHDIPASGSSFNQVIPNLSSGKQYDFQVAVRRQDSGLWTNSGTFSATTLTQNKFFDFGDI